ncbi:hypothetical protein L596_023101 [Steinernema carpocapsae]|uniref:Uncharacterized protein n=1 Tax=Steinernema carpocapsae TaxID=34508 RepID=A0A4U5MCM4_STECR|nr:hypothetical protein L596_023101 [Steinernema carpocapsae]
MGNLSQFIDEDAMDKLIREELESDDGEAESVRVHPLTPDSITSEPQLPPVPEGFLAPQNSPNPYLRKSVDESKSEHQGPHADESPVNRIKNILSQELNKANVDNQWTRASKVGSVISSNQSPSQPLYPRQESKQAKPVNPVLPANRSPPHPPFPRYGMGQAEAQDQWIRATKAENVMNMPVNIYENVTQQPVIPRQDQNQAKPANPIVPANSSSPHPAFPRYGMRQAEAQSQWICANEAVNVMNASNSSNATPISSLKQPEFCCQNPNQAKAKPIVSVNSSSPSQPPFPRYGMGQVDALSSPKQPEFCCQNTSQTQTPGVTIETSGIITPVVPPANYQISPAQLEILRQKLNEANPSIQLQEQNSATPVNIIDKSDSQPVWQRQMQPPNQWPSANQAQGVISGSAIPEDDQFSDVSDEEDEDSEETNDAETDDTMSVDETNDTPQETNDTTRTSTLDSTPPPTPININIKNLYYFPATNCIHNSLPPQHWPPMVSHNVTFSYILQQAELIKARRNSV